jgi:hypothetical protein
MACTQQEIIVRESLKQVSADAQVLAKLDTIIFELRGIHNELCRQRLQGR